MASYEGNTVELASRKIASLDCQEDKAPIIFIHGVSSSSETWGEMPDEIAEFTKRRVYLVDSRCHGDSPRSNELTFELNADDLLRFMDSKNEPKAILVGHSMGGITAMIVATRAPERVEKLVVEDMSCWPQSVPILDLLEINAGLANAAVNSVPIDVDEKKAFETMYVGLMLHPKEIVENYFKWEDLPKMVYRRLDGQWAFKSNFLLGFLINSEGVLGVKITGVYQGPSCFIYGKSSIIYKLSYVSDVQDHFPNVQTVVIEKARHSVHSECPDEFKNALKNFLKE